MLEARKKTVAEPQFKTMLARNVAEVRAAQRLRYRVFAEEMGARVPGREQGIDCDLYDAYCDHLIVVHTANDEVVGTYRLLNGLQARRAGGFYSDSEFDLTALDGLRDDIVEAGRACIHPRFRGGAVLALLWAGILEYVLAGGFRYLAGCASLSLADGGTQAARIYAALAGERVAPPQYRVVPRVAWNMPRRADGEQHASLPALLKGYRRLGAYVCGAPAWDPDFNTADLFLMLPMAEVDIRYMRRWTRA
ncbi:MAG: GNAT family N-acetyltransferase [Rhodospirillaceae bacterium]